MADYKFVEAAVEITGASERELSKAYKQFITDFKEEITNSINLNK